MENVPIFLEKKNLLGNDDNTYEWVANGIRPEKDNLQNVPAEVCENWYRNFSESKNIIISNLENIRESDPLQYENLKQQNISTLVVVPLYEGQKIIGFMELIILLKKCWIILLICFRLWDILLSPASEGVI